MPKLEGGKPKPVSPDEEYSAIQNALRASVETLGLRPTARELHVSPTGLAKLLEERTAPRTKTARQMKAWYAGWLARTGRVDQAAELALKVLAGLVAPENKEKFTHKVRTLIMQNRSVPAGTSH